MAKTLSELWKTGETVPGSADLVRGGLGIDILNKRAYSKDKYDNIFEIGTEGGGLLWDYDKVYQKGTLITIENTLSGGTILNQEYISKTDNNVGNDPLTDEVNWKLYNVVKWVDEDMTITVGTNGDFPDLQTCLDYIVKYHFIGDTLLTIKIFTDHIIDYRINTTLNKYSGNIEIISESGNVDIVCIPDGKNEIIINISEYPIVFKDITFNISGNLDDNGTDYSHGIFQNVNMSGCTINAENFVIDDTEGYALFTSSNIVDSTIIITNSNPRYLFHNCNWINQFTLIGDTVCTASTKTIIVNQNFSEIMIYDIDLSQVNNNFDNSVWIKDMARAKLFNCKVNNIRITGYSTVELAAGSTYTSCNVDPNIWTKYGVLID